MRTFWWSTLVSALIAIAFFLVLLTDTIGHTATVVVDDYLCTVAPGAAGVLGLFRSRHHAGRVRLGWALLGSSAILWGLGGLAWTVYEVHLGVSLPYPSWADAGYLGSVPPAVVGLALLGGPQSGWPADLRTVLDGALVGTALLFISWATVLGPVFGTGTGPLLDRAIALAYPISDVLVATLAILAVARARGQTRVVMCLLGTGFLVVAVSDSSFAWFTAQGAYGTGNLFDTGYVAGFLLIGSAALYPAREHTLETSEPASVLSLTLPYLPGVGVMGVLIGLELTGRSFHGVLFWVGLAVMLLVFVRQLLSIRVNLLLQRRLQDSVAVLRQRETQLEHQAHHDGLTGLANRALFAAESDRLLHGPAPVPCALLVIDLNGFKDVNDTFGHDVGDELLIAVALRLAASARQSDCVARLGGDEFAMILADVGSGAEAQALVDRIDRCLEGPIRLAELTVQVSASIGVAHSDDGPDVATLLRRADAAMYRAKHPGRDSLATHSVDESAPPPRASAPPLR